VLLLLVVLSAPKRRGAQSNTPTDNHTELVVALFPGQLQVISTRSDSIVAVQNTPDLN
jgi:hypothetical protein